MGGRRPCRKRRSKNWQDPNRIIPTRPKPEKPPVEVDITPPDAPKAPVIDKIIVVE